MTEFADKCDEGALTPDERAEYETYVHFGNFVAILQMKARLRQKQSFRSLMNEAVRQGVRRQAGFRCARLSPQTTSIKCGTVIQMLISHGIES